LADAWPALKQDGILIYATCSYSQEEDEEIMDWISNELMAKNRVLEVDEDWNITKTISSSGSTGYRFWPYNVKGEGFFLSCFQKMDGSPSADINVKTMPGMATKKELAVIENWVKPGGLEFIKHENTVYAWPSACLRDFSFLLANFRVIYSGVLVGELMRDKLVPDHPLALSTICAASIPRFELNEEDAIRYLQRKEIMVQPEQKGWQLVTFQQQPLGWINALANRINNYYPKEMRILKDN
jgi:NOL1/NOP2/fmu family ribosome biogenesis protein